MDDGSPIEFDITGSDNDYIDLTNKMLYVHAKIIKQNGTDLVEDAPLISVCFIFY